MILLSRFKSYQNMKEKNLELLPVACVQKAIIENLYIPIAFRKKITKSTDGLDRVKPVKKTKPKFKKPAH